MVIRYTGFKLELLIETLKPFGFGILLYNIHKIYLKPLTNNLSVDPEFRSNYETVKLKKNYIKTHIPHVLIKALS